MDYLFASLKTSGFWPRVRARALRAPVFFSSLPRQPGRCAPRPRPPQLRCFSKIYKIYRTWAAHVKGFFFPPDHRLTEAMKYEVPCPSPAHRSFADSSGNILGSKLCTGATIRPNFCWFFLFYIVFGSFFLYLSSFSSRLFNFFLFISSYSSSSYSSLIFNCSLSF
jgi:hypothetical protein